MAAPPTIDVASDPVNPPSFEPNYCSYTNIRCQRVVTPIQVVFILTFKTLKNMSSVTFQGKPVQLQSVLPKKGDKAADFTAVKPDLSEISLKDLRGKKVLLNIFPSVDTGVCAKSVREFNKRAAEVEGCEVLCLSMDLPFALGRFCAAEGIERVTTASVFRSKEFEGYGLKMQDGPLAGLCARTVICLDGEGTIIYEQLVPEIGEEPDYDAALNALK